MELNIVIKLRRISWVTKLSIACALISALLSLVSLITPHWICAKEVDWPMTTIVSHDEGKALFEKFKQLTTTKEIKHSHDSEKIAEKQQNVMDGGLSENNATFPKVKVKVNETIPDLWQSIVTNNNNNNTTQASITLSNITHFLNNSINSTSLDKYHQDSEEMVDSIGVGPLGYRTLTPVNQSTGSGNTIYADSREINEEIELFLFNHSDTSKLVR